MSNGTWTFDLSRHLSLEVLRLYVGHVVRQWYRHHALTLLRHISMGADPVVPDHAGLMPKGLLQSLTLSQIADKRDGVAQPIVLPREGSTPFMSRNNRGRFRT
jgi:hypothetical protein